jgi:small subunit ribosomal protein S16e
MPPQVNGRPLELVEPRALQFKLQEPILLLGKDRFADIDIRIRVKGGGHTSQIYAIRQALSKVGYVFFVTLFTNVSTGLLRCWKMCHRSTCSVADPGSDAFCDWETGWKKSGSGIYIIPNHISNS